MHRRLECPIVPAKVPLKRKIFEKSSYLPLLRGRPVSPMAAPSSGFSDETPLALISEVLPLLKVLRGVKTFMFLRRGSSPDSGLARPFAAMRASIFPQQSSKTSYLLRCPPDPAPSSFGCSECLGPSWQISGSPASPWAKGSTHGTHSQRLPNNFSESLPQKLQGISVLYGDAFPP